MFIHASSDFTKNEAGKHGVSKPRNVCSPRKSDPKRIQLMHACSSDGNYRVVIPSPLQKLKSKNVVSS